MSLPAHELEPRPAGPGRAWRRTDTRHLARLLAVVAAPRIVATAWHAGAKLVYGFEHAGPLLKAADALQLVFLVIPLLGLVFTFVRIGRRASAGAWRWSAGSRCRRC